MTKFRVRVKLAFICHVDMVAEAEDAAYDYVEKQVEDREIVVPRDYGDMERDISVVREFA